MSKDLADYLEDIAKLFKQYGIKSITMDDIAREVGISKKTLYLHFKDKDEVVSKAMYNELKHQYLGIDHFNRLHNNAIDQLCFINTHILNSILNFNPSLYYSLDKYYPQLWKQLIKDRKDHIIQRIKQNYHRGMEQGIYRKNLDPEQVPFFYSFLLRFKDLAEYQENPAGFNEMFHSIFKTHLREIVNSNGFKYLEQELLQSEIGSL